jgi:hypothetical protein
VCFSPSASGSRGEQLAPLERTDKVLTNCNRYKWAPLKTRKMVYSPMQQKSILDQIPKPNTQGKTNQ